MGLSNIKETLEKHITVRGSLQQCMGSSAYLCGSHIDPTRLVSQNMSFWAPHSASRRKVKVNIILYD